MDFSGSPAAHSLQRARPLGPVALTGLRLQRAVVGTLAPVDDLRRGGALELLLRCDFQRLRGLEGH